MRYTLLMLILLLTSGCSMLPALSAINSADANHTITLASHQPRTLDPARTLGDADSPIGYIFSGLVTLDQNLRVEPELAIGWDVSDDRLTYTFFLHPEARFHDGRDLTAADVKFSWERALDPNTDSSTAATYLGDIVGAEAVQSGSSNNLSGVRVIDDKTFAVTIDAPKPYFLAKLTYPVSYVIDRLQIYTNGWEKEANGSGPFKLDRWRDDEIISLSKNSDYYKPSGNVEQIIYKLDSGLPLAEFEQGEIDLVGIGESAIERVRDPDDPLAGNIFTQPSLCTTFIGINNSLPPFDDVRVRQAFNYALDKQRLVDGLYAGSALAASGVLPPGMPGATAQDVYPYDPDRARTLLQEADFDTSQPLVFTAAGYSGVGATPTAVISLWEEVLGIEIEVQLVEPFLYSAEIYAGNVGNFFSYGWCADYLDPENFLSILFASDSAQNWGRYNNPAIDSLLKTASTEPDVANRMALYAEIETQIIADAPYTFLAHSVSSILVNPRIENYAFTPIGIPQWQRVTINDN